MSKEKESINFIGLSFTGQLQTADEKVVCFTCKDKSDLIGLRSNAWFDKYTSGSGKYVHFKCLSKQRLQEMKEADNLDTINYHNQQKLKVC